VKRYGLEGSEALTVAVGMLFELLPKDHLVLGMAHRGRLNLMAALMGYPLEALFHKLGGEHELPDGWHGTGDVLSHLGKWHFRKRIIINF
jgi:2-oxoglutarate dehydrogenase complex dehydrogenase (E1) component-like enzyme